MKAIQVHQFGGPEVLALHDVPTPKPGAGEVLVRVRAAGVNPYDTYMRNGAYAVKPALPYTPGSDAAGAIEAVGGGVVKVKPGDRVYTATTLSGCLCRICVGEREPGVPAAGKNLVLARRGVVGAIRHRLYGLASPCRCTRRRNLLVHGASGGVGIAAGCGLHALWD